MCKNHKNLRDWVKLYMWHHKWQRNEPNSSSSWGGGGSYIYTSQSYLEESIRELFLHSVKLEYLSINSNSFLVSLVSWRYFTIELSNNFKD